jgi:hypothetical protein
VPIDHDPLRRGGAGVGQTGKERKHQSAERCTITLCPFRCRRAAVIVLAKNGMIRIELAPNLKWGVEPGGMPGG